MLSTCLIAHSVATGESTTESHKNDWGTEDSLSYDQFERAGMAQAQEGSRKPHQLV